VGAQGQTSTFTYDDNNNLISTIDLLGHQTTYSYDALYRLTQVLDPNGGLTSYVYDSANNLTQITDPRKNTTIYTYNGLNELTKQVSPDTGTSRFTYDSVGNVLTKTDARGATATYTYDPLNRPTQIVYSGNGASETHIFTYDNGANGRGRLTQVSDPAATTSWSYNSQGRLASKTQSIGTAIRTVSYRYNSGGQLIATTTPSGQQIGYSYTNNRVSSITINGQPLITGAATEPFGPLAVWFWSNGLKMFRDYDNDGRLVTWEFRNGTPILRKDQSFDLASRIIGISDPINSAANQIYQYDSLDRLVSAQTGSPVAHIQQFFYDDVGNRQNVTSDGAATNYSYNATDNRLQAMAGAVAASYLNGATSLAFTYNNANRLAAVQSNGTPLAAYAVNALGQRISKTVGGVSTRFVYDELGHLLGEYDDTDNLIQETIWLEEMPVATLRPTGATGNSTQINVYYVHADHLATPRAVTRPSDNVIMWQWDNLDPFGANPPNENPAGQGAFNYNLRFPGQYHDAEVGTSYNYRRDYDPIVGRYEQSDLIGLRGGINTYVYVVSDPISGVDPSGLARRDPPKGPGKGCGAGYGTGVPDNPLVIFKFKQCCWDHDDCYDDCNKQPTKAQCDDAFCDCLWNTCAYSIYADVCRFLANTYCEFARMGGKLSRKCVTCVPPYAAPEPNPANIYRSI
jgi:RHS repeat-associated protein